MTAKTWLNRGWRVNEEIETLLRSKRTMFERLTNMTTSFTGMPGAASPDPHRMDEYAAFCQQIDRRARELTIISLEILAVIARVQDGRYRQLLILRYVEFLTWEQIAVRLHYSWRWTMQLHAEALQAVERVLVGAGIIKKHKKAY